MDTPLNESTAATTQDDDPTHDNEHIAAKRSLYTHAKEIGAPMAIVERCLEDLNKAIKARKAQRTVVLPLLRKNLSVASSHVAQHEAAVTLI